MPKPGLPTGLLRVVVTRFSPFSLQSPFASSWYEVARYLIIFVFPFRPRLARPRGVLVSPNVIHNQTRTVTERSGPQANTIAARCIAVDVAGTFACRRVSVWRSGLPCTPFWKGIVHWRQGLPPDRALALRSVTSIRPPARVAIGGSGNGSAGREWDVPEKRLRRIASRPAFPDHAIHSDHAPGSWREQAVHVIRRTSRSKLTFQAGRHASRSRICRTH
jgi:hypothetical protein